MVDKICNILNELIYKILIEDKFNRFKNLSNIITIERFNKKSSNSIWLNGAIRK